LRELRRQSRRLQVFPIRRTIFSVTTLARALKYAWAAPYTALGLLLGLFCLLLGGTWRRKLGALEFAGGALGRGIGRLPQPVRFSAMTLGHVIIGVDHAALAQLRRHEHVHVRQYERWGPLFLPAYLLSSLLQLLRGRNPYRENHFERQAYALAPERPRPQRNG
jgi:hypothetical protein